MCPPFSRSYGSVWIIGEQTHFSMTNTSKRLHPEEHLSVLESWHWILQLYIQGTKIILIIGKPRLLYVDWFQLPSHGHVGAKHFHVYPALPLQKVQSLNGRFQWSKREMSIVRSLRSQDFVPFVLLCLALALPRGCMWLQAALFGLGLLYLRSLCRFVCSLVQSPRSVECWQLCISQPFTSSTQSQLEISLGGSHGKPMWHMMWLDVTRCASFVAPGISGRASATASSTVHWSPWWMTHALQDAAVMWSPWMPRWEARPSFMEHKPLSH